MTKAKRFERALRVIAAIGFKNMNEDGGGWCIPAALTVRDFLRELGFQAEARSVALRITAMWPGRLPRQIFIGGRLEPTNASGKGWDAPGWNGHLIVTSRGLLIDSSFGQCRRPWWPEIPDVALVPLIHPGFRERVIDGDKAMPVIARKAFKDGEMEFETLWAATPANSGWKTAPAARPERWRPMVDEMLDLLRADPLNESRARRNEQP